MEWYSLSNEGEVASPALLLFEERIEANLQVMLKIAGGPERLRPHVKTHKLGPLVRRQMALGITKFKAATIAEAEMCAREGASDILVAMPMIGPNATRLCALMREFSDTRFSALVDSEASVSALNEAGQEAALIPGAYLDIDCGQHRTGVPADVRAVNLYRWMSKATGLRVQGLHAYDGHIHEPDEALRRAEFDAAMGPVLTLRKALESAGLSVPALVAGGSPTFAFHAGYRDREYSPGTTVLWDFGYGDKFPDLPFRPAAVLLTRVISKPGPNRLCLDLGHKAVAAENPHPRVRFLELPDAVAVMHSEEHLVVETPRADEFSIGDTLHGIPRHVCPTVALYGEATVVRGGAAAESWPITARARRIAI